MRHVNGDDLERTQHQNFECGIGLAFKEPTPSSDGLDGARPHTQPCTQNWSTGISRVEILDHKNPKLQFENFEHEPSQSVQ